MSKTYLITVGWTRTTFLNGKSVHHHVPSTFILRGIHPAEWFNRVNSNHYKEEMRQDYVTYESLVFFSEVPAGTYEYLQDLTKVNAGDN